MQPCVVCLDVSNPSKAAWCHEDCLSVAARHRMDKGRPAEWRCDTCASQPRLDLLCSSMLTELPCQCCKGIVGRFCAWKILRASCGMESFICVFYMLDTGKCNRTRRMEQSIACPNCTTLCCSSTVACHTSRLVLHRVESMSLFAVLVSNALLLQRPKMAC